jgi:hypothetical protein
LSKPKLIKNCRAEEEEEEEVTLIKPLLSFNDSILTSFRGAPSGKDHKYRFLSKRLKVSTDS